MSKVGEAWVEIGANTKALGAGLAGAEKSVQEFAGRANSLLAGIGLGISAGAFIKFFTDSIKAASDLNESVNKIEVTFGSASGSVLKFADEMAAKFGMVKSKTLDAAANIGLIGQASGLTSAESAKLSITMVKLAADASSLYNSDVDVALEKVRSGLVGEAEPLRTFGVLLSEDAVKAEAYRSKLAEVGKELTDGQKVQARAIIIQRDLAKASGDLERTSDGVANQLRRVAGDWENFQAAVGKDLVPVVSETIRLGYDLGEAFKVAFDTSPLDVFKTALQGITDDLIGLRILAKGFNTGDFTGASEEILFKKLGGAITGFAGDLASGGVNEKPKPKPAEKPITHFWPGGEFGSGGGPNPFGMMSMLSPFGALSPIGQAQLRTEPRQYNATSQQMSPESFGSMAIMKSLEGSQSPMAKALEEQKKANEHLRDILQELKTPHPTPSGKAGVFPRRGGR